MNRSVFLDGSDALRLDSLGDFLVNHPYISLGFCTGRAVAMGFGIAEADESSDWDAVKEPKLNYHNIGT